MSVGPISSSGGASLDPAGSSAAARPDPSGAGSASAVARGSTPLNPLAAIEASPPPPSGADSGAHLRGYDHLDALLRDAGGADGVISREDAAGLVATLRDEGRGSAALAAEHLFAMIDDYDGDEVTGYDLDRARPLVSMWLESGDGAEKPLGLSLLELGRGLAAPPRRGRLPYATPERGLDHAATLIRRAHHGDDVTSRADVQGLVGQLRDTGRGAEALAVELLYGYIDDEVTAPRERVTEASIQRAVGQATDDLLRAFDGNHNGYSQSELDAMPPLGKALVDLGRLMDGDVVGQTGLIRRADLDGFDENHPLPDGWTPALSVSDGTFRVDGSDVTLEGISGRSLEEQRVLEAAFRQIWQRSTRHRVNPGEPARVADNGSMDIGSWIDPASGERLWLARWNDVDDDSYVFWFAKSAGHTPEDPSFINRKAIFLN